MTQGPLIVAVSLSLGSLGAGATESHCQRDEATLFSCRAANGKIISVCGSRQLSATEGYLQYRYGAKGAPELIYPPTKDARREILESGTLMYSGGGGAYLRFKRDDYGYVVYTASGRGWGSRAGVAVEKDGRLAADVRCKGSAVSEIGPDLFANAGVPADRLGFDLP
jgi:hypothetical protein